MEYREWEPYYQQILSDFGFDRRRDEQAALILSQLLPPVTDAPVELRRALGGKVVTVLGNAPGLEAELPHATGTVIAADEAVSVALSKGILPDIVVTDLDGRIEDLLVAAKRGSIVIIHAHGDNMPALKKWAGRFSSSCMGTTQSRPFANIHNFGGFTDGDRAAFLADHFGAREIRLIGFDFEKPNPKDQPPEVKMKKLAWAKKLLGILRRRCPILFPSSSSSG
ncbi:MAG: 6-hydroxymethylpterin diphosphokinase MptE-like protein [Thermoplasmata archaeon]